MNQHSTAESHDPIKRFGLVVGCLTVASIILYSIAMLISKDSHIAMAVASLPIIAVSHLYELLERLQSRHAQRIAAQPPAAQPEAPAVQPPVRQEAPARQDVQAPQEIAAHSITAYEEFGLPWYLMVVYGALLLPAVLQLGSGLALIPATLFARTDTEAMVSVMAVTLVVGWFGTYFVGKWIGTRSRTRGAVAVALVLVIGSFLSKTFDFVVMSDDDIARVVRDPQAGKSVSTFIMAIIALWVFYAGPIYLGYWMGRRGRLHKYFSYLLAVLPKDTRNLVVTLAYEEAQRLAADRVIASARGATRSPPPLPTASYQPAVPSKPQHLPGGPKKPQSLPV